uniref:SWIM-type domain-containing protein n=1 Tax=Amphimedon queenslandica TaxID=400682 RepID=A0A1X7VAJ5_AMPQE
MAPSYISTLPEVEKSDMYKKIKDISKKNYDASVDPYEITDGWVDDISLWPPVEYGCIYTYLIETPGPYTKEKMKAYNSLDAYNFYINGWVQTVFLFSFPSNPDVCVLKAKVRPSQRTTNFHQTWTAVKKEDGTILTGHCTCMAGCGEVCSHVAAILFKVEACIRLGIAAKTCTSLPCVWNQSFSTLTLPSPVFQINFEKPRKRFRKEGETVSQPQRNTLANPRISETVLLQELHKVCPTAAVFTVKAGFPCQQLSMREYSIDDSDATLSEEEESSTSGDDVQLLKDSDDTSAPDMDPDLPQVLTDLYEPSVTAVNLHNVRSRTFISLTVTQTQAKNLAEATTQQAKSEVLINHRKGRITASHMHSILRHMGKRYPTSIVKSIMQYYAVNPNAQALK